MHWRDALLGGLLLCNTITLLMVATRGGLAAPRLFREAQPAQLVALTQDAAACTPGHCSIAVLDPASLADAAGVPTCSVHDPEVRTDVTLRHLLLLRALW